MTYPGSDDLSIVIRWLPVRAREIYRSAFDTAFDAMCRVHGEQCRECADRVAWAAVKRAGFEKNERSGEWLRV